MRIALENNNKLFNKIKKESTLILLLLGLFIIVFQIVFYNESLFVLTWAVSSFFITFTIPGFIICYLWEEKLDFLERFIISNMVGIITVGVISYNISIYTNIDLKYLSIASPIIVVIISIITIYFKEKMNINGCEKNEQKSV